MTTTDAQNVILSQPMLDGLWPLNHHITDFLQGYLPCSNAHIISADLSKLSTFAMGIAAVFDLSMKFLIPLTTIHWFQFF